MTTYVNSLKFFRSDNRSLTADLQCNTFVALVCSHEFDAAVSTPLIVPTVNNAIHGLAASNELIGSLAGISMFRS